MTADTPEPFEPDPEYFDHPDTMDPHSQAGPSGWRHLRLQDLAGLARLFAVVLALALASGGLLLFFAYGSQQAMAEDTEPVVADRLPDLPTEEVEPVVPELPEPPPRPKPDKETTRFNRQDRNDDGVISREEFLHLTRRNFDKRDLNGDGVLSFEEYAADKIRKFHEVDSNGDGVLNRKEFAVTAPKPRKKPSCKC